ncbi:Uncharacterized protein DBV15_12216 [Temnothorax longispinosus]|uniref:Odorant receptor n=1 Tax=Temnothorax longispinosus TaxID=300112 RepID=A0A4S2KGG6_9HYME|nr:Uncharacterized protein DBV15_12216 [Temnothorax longispinosus]
MTERKDIWQSRYYAIPRLYMTLAGLWPYHPIRDRYLHFVPTFTICSIILIPMIKACLKTIEDDWLSLNTDSEKAILQLFMVTTGLLYMLKSIVLIMIEDTLNSTRLAVTKLPFRVEYGYKIDQYFYPILIHCYLTVYSHVTATVAADTLYFALIQHACGMFSVVGHMLEHIGENINANFDLKPDKKNDKNYHKAFNCLRKHLHVIEFAELIESTFTHIFLVSVSLNMIGGSICGIQVLMNLNDAKDIIAPLAIYVAQLTHLFFQFWQAQFLLDYSVAPYESICRGNWYYTSERCRKLLLLIMSRTILPCRITAGKVATLSIESFGVFVVLMFLKMDERQNIWQSRFYTVPKAYMSLIGIWPYHAFRDRCMLFVPMFTFSITILMPQKSEFDPN